MQEGYAAYGIYWALIELLRDAPNYKYNSDEKVLAYVLHAQDTDQVYRVVRNHGLFDFDDGGLMYSPWLMQQLNGYDEKRKAAQEAGRRGAEKRWHRTEKMDNRDAIATLSGNDRDAIANNILPNNIKPNSTLPNLGNGKDWRDFVNKESKVVSEDFIFEWSAMDDNDHRRGYIAQVCFNYKMSEEVCFGLCELMDGARYDHPLYIKFCDLVKRIQAEKFTPKQPANFFFAKLLE